MNCSKCNALIPDDAAFCPECGAPVEPPVPEEPAGKGFCPNCGAELEGDSVFCGNCGARLDAPVPPESNPAPEKPKTRKDIKFPVKKLVLAVAALAAVVVLVLLVSSLFSGGANSYAVYIKDNQLQYGELPKLEEVQEITSRLTDGNDLDNPYDLQYYVRMTEDGKKLFYPDRVKYDYAWVEEFTLYCRYISNPKKDAVKIDSGISSYEINKNGTMVYYIKNENLYQHDLKEKTKIDSDVMGFLLSEDEKSVLYLTYADEDDEGTVYDVYLARNGKEPEKILSDVTSLAHFSENFSTLVFTKNDSLYVKHGSEDAVKIASDIAQVVQTFDSGEIYYTVMDEEEITYWDLIEDDMSDPAYTEYFSEYLSSETMYNPVTTLYYYNGKESVVVAENVVNWQYMSCDRAVLVYDRYDGTGLPRMKLSEYVEYYPDLYYWVTDELEKNSVSCVALGDASEELDVSAIDSLHINTAGTVLYVATDYDPDYNCYSLYKIVLGKNSVESCDMLDDEVYWRIILNGDSVLYFKDVDEDGGELYRDGSFIDEDVAANNWVSVRDGNVYYLKDYDDNKALGTLTYYNGKESVTVKDDVHHFYITEDGDILFLYDYNVNREKGELWILDGKKTRKLDEDVSYIILVN